jgi:hypothetical protein
VPSKGASSLWVPGGSSEAEGAFVVETVDADVAKTSACEADFVVKPVSSIHREVEFPIESRFCRVHDGFLSSIQWKGRCRGS